MTVDQLIKRLRKFPRDWKVGCTHHDNSDGELQGNIFDVCELKPGIDLDENGPTVVLRT